MSADLDDLSSDEEVKLINFENWISRSNFIAFFHEIYYSTFISICLGKAENQYIRALDSSRPHPRSLLPYHPGSVTKEYAMDKFQKKKKKKAYILFLSLKHLTLSLLHRILK